jgi:hypothetical protein
MESWKNLSIYMKAGILLMLLGFLVLGVEDVLLDESTLLTTLYLLPIGCFFSSFIAFLISAKRTSEKQLPNH